MLVEVHIGYLTSELSHHHVILLNLVKENFKIKMLLGLSLQHVFNSLFFRLNFVFGVIKLRIRVLPYLHFLSLSNMCDHSLKVVKHIIQLLLDLLHFLEALVFIYEVGVLQSMLLLIIRWQR